MSTRRGLLTAPAGEAGAGAERDRRAEVAGGGGPQATPLALSAQVESLLFVAGGPVAVADLARALEVDRRQVERALADLAAESRRRGIRVQLVNGQVQMVSAPEAAEAIQRLLGLEASARLSRAALEVLAMVAYRQPVTRPEIDALRGVNSETALRTLLARGLVEPLGRRETVGHPIEYGTTFLFLEYFGLSSLDELPPLGAVADEGAAALEEVAAAAGARGDQAAGTSRPPRGTAGDAKQRGVDEAAGQGAVGAAGQGAGAAKEAHRGPGEDSKAGEDG